VIPGVIGFASLIPTMCTYVLTAVLAVFPHDCIPSVLRQQHQCSPTSPTWLSNAYYFQDPKCWAQPPQLGPYVRGGGAVVG